MRPINTTQQRRDRNGQRDVCSACGHDGTEKDPLTLSSDGWRIHTSHTSDPRDGFYRDEQKD